MNAKEQEQLNSLCDKVVDNLADLGESLTTAEQCRQYARTLQSLSLLLEKLKQPGLDIT